MTPLNENTLEIACIEWFKEIGYDHLSREDTVTSNDKDGYREVIFKSAFRNKLFDFNPQVPMDAIDEAISKIESLHGDNINKNNQLFHDMFTNGIPVRYHKDDNAVDDIVNIVDFNNPNNNEFAVVDQFTVIIGDENKRPDLVILINGLPIGVCELKNMFNIDTTILDAYNQLQTYKDKIPDLFFFNELLVISDGSTARIGSVTADFERFAPWRTLDNLVEADKSYFELEVLVKGVFAKEKILDLIKNFITFKDNDIGTNKIIAMYHQVGAVNKALDTTVQAVKGEDKRAGVIWHTQGSGKSFSMLFFASKLIKLPELNNPTVIVLTDRNDLDNQIYSNFSTSRDILRDIERADSIASLEKMLQREAGGILFSTMQKFRDEEYSKESFIQVNERENIIVIADEAHRTQYGTKTGYARNMRKALPNATFIGFTGTPINLEEKSTINVFGDLIDIYDIEQSIKDGATVNIYYEPRLAKIDLTNILVDEDYEEINEDVEFDIKQAGKAKWAALEKVVGTQERLTTVGHDIVNHFNYRDQQINGKAMIVVMSRRIALDLYNILKSVPGVPGLTIVMTTSSSDGPEYNKFKRNNNEQREIENKFKDPDDPLKIVIVCDMWLTGFDIPCLHTMYIDKPMKDHNLMQAIARVNRVFKDKEGGLIVDYIGIADNLKKALSFYTKDGIGSHKILEVDDLIGLLRDKIEIVRDFFMGIEIDGLLNMKEIEQLNLIKKGADHILSGGDENKINFVRETEALIKLFALLPYSQEIEGYREERIFYERVRQFLIKSSVGIKDKTIRDTAIRQLINQSIGSEGIKDISEILGGGDPEISILSEGFLADVASLKFENIQIELLRKAISGEIIRSRKFNLAKYKNFKELLEKTIANYHNKVLSSAVIIKALVDLAREIMAEEDALDKSSMTREEHAFYDAIMENGQDILNDKKSKEVVKEIIKSIKDNLTIDWSSREDIKAGMRADVKRVLRRSGFSDKAQNSIVKNIMQQAEELWRDFIAA